MACRWYLVLGVALLQGVLSFSPIPEMSLDEEWAAFNEQLQDVNFRLPTTTAPRLYEVTLTPYLTNAPAGQQFTFEGNVAIYLSATQAGVSEIVMHCDVAITSLTLSYMPATGDTAVIVPLAPNNDFSCDPTTKFLRIVTAAPLTQNQEYIVQANFNGILQENMRGFYRSWYRDSTGIRWMATTQFQPGHARQAFPCYDEPSFKANFVITIVRESDFSPTISNMPMASFSNLGNNRISETFLTTPKTSTYLLAFIVSHYIVVESSDVPNRPFQIFARNNIETHGAWSLDVGTRLLQEMEDYTGISYYGMQTHMNMKQAAIPDFSAGAMENWGLLTYREALLLYHEHHSNHFYKQRIANIISHEIAHMWFGNLVTCAWWDNLWLNEGFARYYQYFLTHRVEPDLGFETRFVVEQVQVSLLSDSVNNAHALTNPAVGSPNTVSNHFSQITYGKGASVFRQTEYLLGQSTYNKALRSYLNARQYDVAEPHHLFEAFDSAATEDNALTAYGTGFTIAQYFRSWSENPGHPVLTVNVNHETGQMTVSQRRFEVTANLPANNFLYEVPITWTRAGNVNFGDLKPVQVLAQESTTISRGSTGFEWVIFNKQQTGFYRVNYDDITWALITRALRSEDRSQIHEYNRAQIVDDLFNFARAGILSYSTAFNVLSFLEFEDEYAPWIAATVGFNFAIRRLAHDNDNRQKLNEYIIQFSNAVVERLGYIDIEGEPFMNGLLRMYVMTFLCNVGHEGCLAAARANFANWRANPVGNTVRPNMRPWVYCSGLRQGTAEDFNFYWARYLEADHASDQLVMIQAAGCTSDTDSLNNFWNAITAPGDANLPDVIRPQDISSAISSAITSNEENTLRSFAWFQANLERVRNTIGVSTLTTVFSRLLNDNDIEQASTWLEANRANLGESTESPTAIYDALNNALNTARSNINWYNTRATEFASFFETGYEQVVIDGLDDVSTTTTSGEPMTEDPITDDPRTEEPSTDEPTPVETTTPPPPDNSEEDNSGEDDNSANIATLSFITLIVTLSINALA